MKTNLLRYKYVYSFMLCITMLFSYSISWGQGFEDFSNSNATPSYSNNSFVGNNGITWSYVESRDGNGDDNNSGINLPALMLRQSSDNSAVTSSSISGGIGNFSVKLYKGFTGGGNRQVELFVNGVSQGASTPFDDFNEHVFTVNNIDISGDITIEIRNITGKQIIVDDISWTAYAGTTNDQTTEVYAPANQVEAKTVTAADITSMANTTDVFKFTVEDQGSGDGLPTNLTRIRLVPGPNNTADWANHLQGFQVMDSNINIYTPTTTISDTEVFLDFVTPVSIPDAGSLDFEVFAYLNTSNIQDDSVLQFQIDAANHGFLANTSGSGFLPSFISGDVVGNNITIDVEATQLSYLQQPNNVIVDEVMSPAVEIAYTDVNNNIDIDYSGIGFDISLISSASFDASATTIVEAVNGVATFSNLIFDTEVTGVYLTAADNTTFIAGTYDSANFDVTAPVSGATDLFFSEYIEGSSNNKYIEIYNGTGAPVNLAEYSIELYNNGSTTANNAEDFTDPAFPTSLNNGETLVLRNTSANIHPASVSTYSSTVANYNGDDAIALIKNGAVIDIIGEIGNDPGSGWDVAGISSATQDYTLVRKSDVCSPNTSWAASAGTTAANSEWIVNPIDDISNLGSHTANCGTLSSVTYIYDGVSWTPTNPNGVSTVIDNIKVTSGTAQITTETSANNIDINMGATLEVTPAGVLNIDNNLIVDGSLIFKSDATGSGQLGDINGTIGGSEKISIERYIPAKRAFRLLSSPVNGQTFADAWQQNTHITGVGGAANGFDPTPTNNPSLFIFNNSLPTQAGGAAWEAVTSTTESINAGQGYRLMVRGDRTIDLTSQNPTPTPTTLMSKGDLTTGNYTPILAQGDGFYSLIGNPYQAIVDFSQLTFSGDINNSNIYVWDPTMTGSNGRGAYVTVDVASNSPNPSSSEANKYIMPGQAFFVQNNAEINQAPSITFTENAKDTAQSQTSVFSTIDEFYVNFRLYKSSALQNDESESDAIGLRFADYYTTPSSDEDASKLANPGENFAVVNDKFTSIDKRAMPLDNEEIELFISGYEAQNYDIKFMLGHQPEDIKLYLNDNYLESSVEITDDMLYSFSVDSNSPASIAADRFYISFENVTMGTTQPNLADAIRIYPNPAADVLNIDVKNYEIEKLKIFNIQGQELSSVSSTKSINVSSLKSGVYILKVYTNQGTSVQKFIKK